MKTTENYLAEIQEIRKMMQDSSRFLSLSGMSGILIGVYALAGAWFAYRALYAKPVVAEASRSSLITQIALLAVFILILSLITVIILTRRRAKKAGTKIWNPGSKLMLINLSIPLLAGGALLLIFAFKGVYEIIAPACLVFYGLALVNAAKFTRQEIFYLGLLQVILGLMAALFPSFGLFLWALGFGVLHIFYGSLMYFRYEHNTIQ